jgi:hypothetical protein
VKHLRVQSVAGRLELYLPDETRLESVLELCRERAVERRAFAGAVEFGGKSAWLKAGALRGRARLRHSIARLALESPPPRVREALNLAWMEARLFQVPTPLAAGWTGGALPDWQFLLLEQLQGSPLDQVLRDAQPAQRQELLGELARETARLHALHFIHRDLYWRNFLVLSDPAPRKLVFLDAWRGGERLQWRGEDYDLACLFLEGPSLLTPLEIRAWLSTYREERAALGSPLREAPLWRAANRSRRALLERVRREPGRWRWPEAPVQDFDFSKAAR